MESDLNNNSTTPSSPNSEKSDLSSADFVAWILFAILIVLVVYLMVGVCSASHACRVVLRRRGTRQIHPFRNTNRYEDGQTLESVQITETHNGKSKLGSLSVASFLHTEIPSSEDKSNVATKKHVFVNPVKKFFPPDNGNFEVDENNNNCEYLESTIQQAPNVQIYIATTSQDEKSDGEEGEEEGLEEGEVPYSQDEDEIVDYVPSFYGEGNPTDEEDIEEEEGFEDEEYAEVEEILPPSRDELEAQNISETPGPGSTMELPEYSQAKILENETSPTESAPGNDAIPIAENQSVAADSVPENDALPIAENQVAADSVPENDALPIAENQSVAADSVPESIALPIAENPSVAADSVPENIPLPIAENQIVTADSVPENDALPIAEKQSVGAGFVPENSALPTAEGQIVVQTPSALDNTINPTYTESLPAVLNTQDTPETSGAGNTMGTYSLLELSQMEGGWLREKVVNPGNSAQQESSNSHPSDCLGSQYEVGEYLQPIQDFVAALAMSAAVSESCMAVPVDPGVPPDPEVVGVYRTEAFTDQDQIEIRNEMDRLTTTRCTGTRTLLDFMQAEGSDWRYQCGLADRNAPGKHRDGCTDVAKGNQIPNAENEATVLYVEGSIKGTEPEEGEETLGQNSALILEPNEDEYWDEDEDEALFQISQPSLDAPLPGPREAEGEGTMMSNPNASEPAEVPVTNPTQGQVEQTPEEPANTQNDPEEPANTENVSGGLANRQNVPEEPTNTENVPGELANTEKPPEEQVSTDKPPQVLNVTAGPGIAPTSTTIQPCGPTTITINLNINTCQDPTKPNASMASNSQKDAGNKGTSIGEDPINPTASAISNPQSRGRDKGASLCQDSANPTAFVDSNPQSRGRNKGASLCQDSANPTAFEDSNPQTQGKLKGVVPHEDSANPNTFLPCNPQSHGQGMNREATLVDESLSNFPSNVPSLQMPSASAYRVNEPPDRRSQGGAAGPRPGEAYRVDQQSPDRRSQGVETGPGYCDCKRFNEEDNYNPSTSYGVITLLDYMQAEGSAYGHTPGARINIGEIGSRITSWLGSAITLTPGSCVSENNPAVTTVPPIHNTTGMNLTDELSTIKRVSRINTEERLQSEKELNELRKVSLNSEVSRNKGSRKSHLMNLDTNEEKPVSRPVSRSGGRGHEEELRSIYEDDLKSASKTD